jgi:hypothetical protein
MDMINADKARIRRARFSQSKSNQYRAAFQRSVVANAWSSQQAADHALGRFQMARKAGYSTADAVEFAFEGLANANR